MNKDLRKKMLAAVKSAKSADEKMLANQMGKLYLKTFKDGESRQMLKDAKTTTSGGARRKKPAAMSSGSPKEITRTSADFNTGKARAGAVAAKTPAEVIKATNEEELLTEYSIMTEEQLIDEFGSFELFVKHVNEKFELSLDPKAKYEDAIELIKAFAETE